MEKINVAQKFAQFSDKWSPKIVAEVQDCYVKFAKLQGEFIWHKHDSEDEMFYVVQGRLLLKFRDQDVWLEPGEFIVVPRGVEHLPVADEEVHLILIEPKVTLNTGDVQNERTVAQLDRL